jgi:hypothetical protein
MTLVKKCSGSNNYDLATFPHLEGSVLVSELTEFDAELKTTRIQSKIKESGTLLAAEHICNHEMPDTNSVEFESNTDLFEEITECEQTEESMGIPAAGEIFLNFYSFLVSEAKKHLS